MSLLNLLFSFHGRIGRRQYWLGMLIVGAIIGMVWVGAVTALASSVLSGDYKTGLATYGLVFLCVIVVASWTNAALQVKRLHDRGRTGWIAAAPLILFIGWIGFIGSSLEGMTHIRHEPLVVSGNWMVMMVIATNVVSILMLVDLGFGPSVGPNKYGDGPGFEGAPSHPSPQPGGKPIKSGPSWDVSRADAAIAEVLAKRNSSESARQPKAASAAQSSAARSTFGVRGSATFGKGPARK